MSAGRATLPARTGIRLIRSAAATGPRARILVVDRDASALAVIRSILRAQDWEVIDARTGAEALQKARLEAPDAVISEIKLPDMGGPDLCRALRQRNETATTPILVLSAGGGVAERVACLRAGASDYLVKPPDAQELIARLQAALDLRRERTGFVIAIVGSKRGVGSTAIAVNLAVALRRETRSGVVLVDAAAHLGAVDIMLNLHVPGGAGHLLRQLEGLEQADLEGALTPHASGIHTLLLSDQSSQTIGSEPLHKVLLGLRRLREFVVVDSPPFTDQAATAVLQVADRVLLVVTPEITALRGARAFLVQATQMGLSRERILPLLNRFPQRGGLQRRAVENALGFSVHAIVPDDVRLVTYSINRGVPVVESHRRAEVSRRLGLLAGDLVGAARQQ